MAGDPLIEQVRARVGDPARAAECADAQIPATPRPPARASDIADTEAQLGFELPALYRALLTEIGNGGFGPGYGLGGVRGGALVDQHPMVAHYRAFVVDGVENPLLHWPDKLLPAASLGCAMYWCVDCSGGGPDGPVVWFEPNPRTHEEPISDFLIPFAPSMRAWFEEWLAGEIDYEGRYTAHFGA